jgi:aconitase A
MREVQNGENVLRILEETKTALEKNDVVALKSLSNQTVHTASVKQDSINITLAVIVYSLSKILERVDYKKYPDWSNFYKALVFAIDGSIIAAKAKDEYKLKKNLEMIRKSINKLSGNFKKYIEEVFRRASISKASRIYEHGISMEKTAKLLGITMYELADYTGRTGIPNMPEGRTVDVKERIKLLESFFG